MHQRDGAKGQNSPSAAWLILRERERKGENKKHAWFGRERVGTIVSQIRSTRPGACAGWLMRTYLSVLASRKAGEMKLRSINRNVYQNATDEGTKKERERRTETRIRKTSRILPSSSSVAKNATAINSFIRPKPAIILLAAFPFEQLKLINCAAPGLFSSSSNLEF